jgi:PAS domain S-box-containing protein
MFSRCVSRAGPFIAVALAAASGLIFDAMTPEVISVTLFYVSVVLVGYWFAQPNAALALALLATPLIIIGHWITIPSETPDWEVWLNRGLAVGTVWLAAAFVRYIRVLEQKLYASNGRLQFALDAARLGWWRYDPLRRVASGDARFQEIFGVTTGELPRDDIKKLVHPDDAERFWADRDAALNPADLESSAHGGEYRVRPREGKLRWVEVRWLAHFAGTGSRGRVVSAVATVQDITERKHGEELLRRQADLLNQSHDAIFALQTGGRGIVYWSRGAERLYGFTAAEAEGRRTHELLQTRAPIPIEDIDAQIVRRGSWYGELTHTTRDGRDIVVESRIVRVSYNGETFALETNRDITERKQHEERERLLVREMNHRVKNVLAVVDAIAHRTAAKNPEDFADRFSQRVRALSANQDLLFRNEWKGVDVEELVRAQLSHFVDLIGSRIVVDGPKLRFNTVGAQAVGLALHELATNASKYGALSTNRGRVNVCWNFSDSVFTMSWTEREGPSVSAPKRRGFGTTVIERMAETSLGGTVDLDYAPSGLTWYLTCPAGNVLERRNGDRFSLGKPNRTKAVHGPHHHPGTSFGAPPPCQDA